MVRSKSSLNDSVAQFGAGSHTKRCVFLTPLSYQAVEVLPTENCILARGLQPRAGVTRAFSSFHSS